MSSNTVPSRDENLPVLNGILTTGTGKAAFFTGLEWVIEQCETKLKFKPWPGTLNVRIDPQDLPVMKSISESQGITLEPPDKNFCESQVYPVRINDIPGALILPEEKVQVHKKDIVEILAPVFLRQALEIEDGSRVTIQLTDSRI